MFILSENRLNDAIFQRMKRNNTDPSSRIQKINHLIQRIPEHIQFMITLNANCLKGFLGRMPVCPHLCRYCRFDDLIQFSCCLNRLVPPCNRNMLCNIFSKLILSVIADNPIKFLFRIFIDNILCLKRLSVIHSHIKWCIILISKTAFYRIQLIRGNSQIQ